MKPALLDPTRTLTLRRSFTARTNGAFRRLINVVSNLVVTEDAFGLNKGAAKAIGGIPGRVASLPINNELSLLPTTNKRWAYKTNEEAADEFEKWLKQQVRKELLSEAEALRWRRYIARGFEKGANRALVEVSRGEGKGAKAKRFIDPTRSLDFAEGQREAFLRTTLQKSTAVEKLRLLQSSALSEVRGLTDTMLVQGRRIVVDSLVRNLSPRETAARLAKVLKVSQGRARTIANTELVRAHAEGQLEAMEALGVERVGVAVEWSSLASACPLCKPLDGVVLKTAEAKGMLPRHPNCRCAWTLANVPNEEGKKPLRSKSKIEKAIKKSQKEGGDREEWGPAAPISKKRPEPLVNCSCSEAELSFASLLCNLGLVNDN